MTSVDQLGQSVGGRERERVDREPEPADVPVEQERHTAVGAHRLERRASAQQRLVVRAKDRRLRVDEAAPGDRHGEQAQTATLPLTAARSGRAFTHDSSISASGSESQTIPPPTQRWIRPSATANVRIVSASSKSPFALDRPERAHRRAAPDGLEPGDVVDRRDLRRTGDRAAREGRAQDLGQPDAGTQAALDRRDEMRHTGELALDHQLRPANRPDPADAREVVALEIDDHHVLGSVLRVVDVLARSAACP